MTLEQLRIFVAVAEREHLTRGAEALNLTQSAVSTAISTLEHRYGVKLFDRIGRRIVLTEAGKLFLTEARNVVAQARVAEQTLFEVAGALRGELRLAASQTVGNYWIAERIMRFRARHPGVTVSLSIGNTEQALERIVAGQADLAIVEGEIDDHRISVSQLNGDQAVLVLPVDFATETIAYPDDLDWASLRFVARERGSGTRAVLETVLDTKGLKLDRGNLVMELPSNEAICHAVEAGAGAALLSFLVVEKSCAAGRLVCRDIGLKPRPFYLLRLKERSAARSETLFEAICKSDIAALH